MKATRRRFSGHAATTLRVLPPCVGLDLSALISVPRRPAMGQVVSFLTGRILTPQSDTGSANALSRASRISVPSVSPCMTSPSTETSMRAKIIPFAMLAASRPSAA